MAITITCPECGKQLKAPPDVLGKKIRCKGCGEVFAARADEDEDEPAPARATSARNGKPAARPAKGPARPAPKAPAKPAAKPKPPAGDKGKGKGDEDEEDASPYDPTTIDLTPRCPECANEMESEDAIICLHCGYNTVTREKARTRKVRDVTGGDMFLWLLPGILCALAVVGLIVFDVLYCTSIESWVDPETWYGTCLCWLGAKIWLVIVSLFAMYHAGRFAIIRLCINNTPPEIEERFG
jgi:hypothetical protein